MQQRLRISANIVTGFLLAWFLLLPVNVQALGFGNIIMKSALNEPLNAEIELMSATSDDIKNLEVKLASREAFLRSGVDRSSLLSRINFDIVKRNGKYYIIMTTPESVREPFLNFLLEMNWKSGRMLREYTVLLDPPDRVQRQQQITRAPETTPAEVEAPAPAPIAIEDAVPAPEPIQGESPFIDSTPVPEQTATADEPLYPAVPLDQPQQVPVDRAPAPEPIAAPEPVPAPEAVPPAEVLAAPEPAFDEQDDGGLFPQIPLRAYRESDLDVAQAPASEPAEVPYEPVGELDYGITKRGDSAWKVAEKLRPSQQISVYQIMMALQQSNPNAFVNGNIHRLKQGQVLRIDDPSLLTAMSKEQAAQQYQAQTQAWEEYLTSVGAAVPRQAIVAGEQTPAMDESAEPSGELTLATPKADESAAGTSTTEPTRDTSNDVDSDVLRAQVRQAMQEAQSERSKNSKLSSKLNELEEELARLENVVTINDSDLASLQHKLEELNAQRAAGPDPEPLPEPIPEPIAESPDAITPTPEPAPEPSATETDIAAATETDPAVLEPSSPIDGGSNAPSVEPIAEPAAPSTPAPGTATDTGGIMAMISGALGGIAAALAGLGGMTMMIAIAVVVVIMILLTFIIIRRKRGIHFQESILNTGGDAIGGNAQLDASPSQGSSLMGGESSFLSDFAISGVSAIQAEDSEVDPLTEADVFMAYGRYEAAEERLQEAINQDPDRGELRVKLLELYNTTKNKQSFETAAEDFYAALGDGAGSDPLWQKVVAMGKQLAPSNPLFSGAAAAGIDSSFAPQADVSNVNQNDVMDIGLDTGVFSTSEFNPIEKTGDGDLDFNLDGGDSASEKDDDGLDFSLGNDDDDGLDFNLDDNTTSTSEEETQNALTSDDGGLDFSLDSDTDNATADDSLEFSLSTSDEPTATDIKLDMDDDASSGLDFDLEMGEDTEPELGMGMDMNLDAGDAMDLDMPDAGDEVGTKLDLARAYIDMGDPDGARSILDEVMEEGNDGQKQEAEQLMSQIG